MKKFTNKPRQPRKLIVHHETIALLTPPQLNKIVGGYMTGYDCPTDPPVI
jgi:hypothetical protein